MGGLREIIEKDLAETIEGDFGLPVELLSPTAGTWQTKSKNDPDLDLQASIMYETVIATPDMDGEMVAHKPFVSLRRSSLDEVPTPLNYENWVVRIPIRPSETASKVSYRIHRPPEGGETIGFIRLYLELIEQS